MTVASLPTRMRLLACVSLLVGLVTLLVPGGASAVSNATKRCGKEVVDDWYGNSRVDKIFPLHCYREAIRTLTVDLVEYSNAEEDILRALAYARKGLDDPGKGAPATPPSGVTTTDPTTGDPTTTDPTGDPTTTDETVVTGAGDDDVDTAGPSAVPIPLLVLGGLALLLLAAGGAGYLNRRRNAGGGPDSTA